MPRDGGGPTNGRSLTYEALVKSLFTTISHAKEPDIPPRPQSRMGFRKNKSARRNRLQQDRPLHRLQETAGATSPHSPDSDEDTADSDTSDEWSTDSDSDTNTTLSNDLRPCSTVPLTSPPILVPDAFPDQGLPNLTIQTDLPVHPPPPLRPMFPHHGLSRSALQHQKWLWNTRYDEWMQWRADVESAEAEMGPYGGISSAVTIEPPPLWRSRAPSPMPPEVEHSPVGKKAELNEKIFPRTGDITALHDPQVARLDQTFSNYPLCTIQKVLFVCCMDTAARGRSPLSRDSGNVNHHSDSEDTVVPSSTIKGAEGEEERALAPHDPPTPESALPLLTKLSREQSWHTRWEVLSALVKMTEQGVLARGPTTIPATVTTPIGLPVVARSLADVDESPDAQVQRRFFVAGSEEPGVNDGCESDDDDEEDDYGEIVLIPHFAMQYDRRPGSRAGIFTCPDTLRSGIKVLGS